MGDVGPPQAVVVAQGDGVTEHRPLGGKPQLAEFLGGQLAPLPSALVHARFERMHGHLAEDSGKDRLEFLADKGPARLRARDQIDLGLEHKHLGEYRGGLGQHQRRVAVVEALGRGQLLVYAVAEFVGHRGHVARVAGVVDQDVRVRLGHAGMGKGPAPLARQHRGVDPAFREEPLGDGPHLR